MWSNSFGFNSRFSVDRELLFNNDGELKELREILHVHMLYTPKLAKLLERIRGDPEDFYNDELAKDIVQDIKDGGGIFKFRSPLNGNPRGLLMVLYSSPGEWVVLIFILNILDDEVLISQTFWCSELSCGFINLRWF